MDEEDWARGTGAAVGAWRCCGLALTWFVIVRVLLPGLVASSTWRCFLDEMGVQPSIWLL
jgi:hypothetical protein